MSGISIDIGAKDAGFSQTISKVKDSTKSLDKTVAQTSSSVNASFASMAKAGAALAIGFGAIKLAAAAITNTFGAFKDALDLGGELSDLSEQTGETAGNVMVLRRAFDNSGVGAEKVGTSINKMQKLLVEASEGSDGARDSFGKLGLSWSDMATKSPMEQLQAVAKAISGLPTPAERATSAMEFFGKSGGRTLAFLQDFDGAIEGAKGELGSLPGIMDANARTFDVISDKIAVIGGKFKEFAAGVLSKMTPLLEVITTGIAGIDVAAFGQRLADAFIGGTSAMEGFTQSLGALKVGEFSLAWEMAWASITLQAKQTANEIYRNLIASFTAAKDFMIGIFGPDSAIFLAVSMGIDLLVGKIQVGILNAALGLADTFPRLFGDAAENIKNNIKVTENGIAQTKGLLGNLFSDGYIERDLIKAGKAFPESFKNAYDSTSPLINVQKDLEKVNELTEKIGKTAAGLTFDMSKDFKEIPLLAWNMKDHMKEGAGAMEKAAKTVKETLSISEQIIKRIKGAESNEKVDPGGKLTKKADDAIAAGNFRKAERISKQIAGKEDDSSIRDAFGGGKAFGKSIRDMAEDQGINITRKSNKELKAELLKRVGDRQGELPSNNRGEDEKGAANKGGKGGADPMSEISKAVEAIRNLVAKIEPKLPTHALSA